MVYSGWLCLFVVPAVISIGFAILTLIITYREKKMVWELAPMPIADAEQGPLSPDEAQVDSADPYRPPAQEVKELPITPFAMEHGTALTQQGYDFLGAYQHAKGGIYQIRYDAFVSPDRMILAFVESGSLASIRVNNVSMVSLGHREGSSASVRTREPTFAIVSLTNDAAFEPDMTGMVEQRHFPRAKPAEQEELHRTRMAQMTVQPFSDLPVEDFRRFRTRVAEVAADHGYLRFLDDDRSVQRPAGLGGVRMFWQIYAFQIGRRIYPHRWRIKRQAKR